MKMKNRKFGFTIVELLTVMGVIAILIGLLAPALQKVRIIATDTKQKAQFHSISISLDMFNSEMEEYPDSTAIGSGNNGVTVGAQHLAAALIGRDYQGYDPLSVGDAKGEENDNIIYADDQSSDEEIADSIDRRKGPYLNAENTEAYQMYQLYADTKTVYDGNRPAPVLTDAYRVKRVSIGSKVLKAGSPILYFKANTSSTIYPAAGNATAGSYGPADFIYNVLDNEDLLACGTVKDPAVLHYQDTGGAYDRAEFYDAIRNLKITGVDRPCNQTSYLLISAGHDGVYGNSDDIYNFSE
ncbi:MAG: type II secretion system GspH family protein [Anaerohalosphaeraceae bacterium]|nr:type II secretion system GspH family protein [Anaerohalosphaeraceae bacterium]